MKINGNTKVSKVIKENKEAIEAIVSLNPHFTKLRNPVLRRLLAPRVNLAEAAKIGKCDVEEMLNALVAIGFELEDDLSTEKPKNKDRKSTRLNSSHVRISYAVFCLKKKKKQ